jgi:hypothetical protein
MTTRFVLLPRDVSGRFTAFDISKVIEAVYTPKDEMFISGRTNWLDDQLNCYCGEGSDYEFRGEQARALWDTILRETKAAYEVKP